MQLVKYMFQPHGDERGQLIALEEFNDIPFTIKRVYYMYDTMPGIVRGKHAHKNLEQILICIHGTWKVKLDNGREKKIVNLEKPYKENTFDIVCQNKYLNDSIYMSRRK